MQNTPFYEKHFNYLTRKVEITYLAMSLCLNMINYPLIWLLLKHLNDCIENTRRYHGYTNVELMLAMGLRRCASIMSTLVERLVFARCI